MADRRRAAVSVMERLPRRPPLPRPLLGIPAPNTFRSLSLASLLKASASRLIQGRNFSSSRASKHIRHRG